MVTRAFKELAILNVAKRGMPHLRITFTPHPVAGKTPEQLRAYVEGDDPISGKPMMKEIVDDLTVPLTRGREEDRDRPAFPLVRKSTAPDTLEKPAAVFTTITA